MERQGEAGNAASALGLGEAPISLLGKPQFDGVEECLPKSLALPAGWPGRVTHTATCDLGGPHDHAESLADHDDHDAGEEGHSHGLIDRAILRSRAGIKAVSISLAVLTVTAFAQAFIYSRTLSVALLADLIHNFGDALTAIPLGLAFFFRSARGERWAGLGVVLAIFISALVALGQTIERFIHPRSLTHLWLLALAGVIGFVGNELAAQVRLRAGKRLGSPALVADGKHARVDGFVSLGVLASAAIVALGLQIADPVIGLVITLVILHITWESWHTVRSENIQVDQYQGD